MRHAAAAANHLGKTALPNSSSPIKISCVGIVRDPALEPDIHCIVTSRLDWNGKFSYQAAQFLPSAFCIGWPILAET